MFYFVIINFNTKFQELFIYDLLKRGPYTTGSQILICIFLVQISFNFVFLVCFQSKRRCWKLRNENCPLAIIVIFHANIDLCASLHELRAWQHAFYVEGYKWKQNLWRIPQWIRDACTFRKSLSEHSSTPYICISSLTYM